MFPTSSSSSNSAAFAFAISLLPPGIKIPSAADMKATDNIKPTIFLVNVVFLILVGITCAARVYVRLFMIKNFGWDDAAMVLACACAVVVGVFCLNALSYGLGQHIWTLDLIKVIPMTMRVVKDLLVVSITYCSAMTFAKLSIIISYLRIFPNPTFRRFLYLLTFIILSLWFCTIWVMLFQCRPISGAWDFTITQRKCLPILNFLYFSAGIGIATDVALCTVPLPLVLKMHLPARQKAGVCVLFAVGGFACVASIMRLSQLHNIVGIDITYTSASPLNWTVVETGTSIVCASIPCLRPLWISAIPQRWRSKDTSAAPSGSGGGLLNRATSPWTSRRRKGDSSFSRTGSDGEEDLPLHSLADEEHGIKKTVAMTMTVNAASRGRRVPNGAPVVFARAYSQEPGREARSTWDSAEELASHPDMGVGRQGSRQGHRTSGGGRDAGSRNGIRGLKGEGLLVPKRIYAR